MRHTYHVQADGFGSYYVADEFGHRVWSAVFSPIRSRVESSASELNAR